MLLAVIRIVLIREKPALVIFVNAETVTLVLVKMKHVAGTVTQRRVSADVHNPCPFVWLAMIAILLMIMDMEDVVCINI